jgi:tetratricopeptide (TPR) repeat protein
MVMVETTLEEVTHRPKRRGRRSLAELRAARGATTTKAFKPVSEKTAANSLGTRVRLARKRLGLSQQELAGPEYVASYISAIERDKIHPSLKALQLIATRLNEPVEYFLYGGYGSGALAETESTSTTTNFIPETSLAMALRDDLLEAQVLVEQVGDVPLTASEKDVDNATKKLESIPRHQLSEYDRALLLYLYGKLHLQKGDYDTARAEYEEALALANKTEQEVLSVEIRNQLGSLYYLRRQVEQAVPYHKSCWETIEANESLFDPSLKLRVMSNLANDYVAQGRQEDAINTFQKALEYDKMFNQPRVRANAYWKLSDTYKERRDLVRSRMYATLATELFEEVNQRRKLLRLSADMGGMLADLGRENEAEKILTKAVTVSEEDASLVGTDLALTYTSLAWLRVRQENLEEARDLSEKAVKEARTASDGIAEGKALKLAAEIATKLNNSKDARQYFKEAIDKLENVSMPYLLSDVYKAYSEALESWGELDQAVVFLKKAYESKR